MELALGFLDREVIDAGEALLHQPIVGELPVLVAVRAKPVPGIVMPFVSEAHRYPVLGEGPELLDEAIIELLHPFARQERDDLGATAEKLRPVSPVAVRGVDQRNQFRVAGIPAVLRASDLLHGSLTAKGR